MAKAMRNRLENKARQTQAGNCGICTRCACRASSTTVTRNLVNRSIAHHYERNNATGMWELSLRKLRNFESARTAYQNPNDRVRQQVLALEEFRSTIGAQSPSLTLIVLNGQDSSCILGSVLVCPVTRIGSVDSVACLVFANVGHRRQRSPILDNAL